MSETGQPLLTIEQGSGLLDGLRDLLQAVLSCALRGGTGVTVPYVSPNVPFQGDKQTGGKDQVGRSGGGTGPVTTRAPKGKAGPWVDPEAGPLWWCHHGPLGPAVLTEPHFF